MILLWVYQRRWVLLEKLTYQQHLKLLLGVGLYQLRYYDAVKKINKYSIVLA